MSSTLTIQNALNFVGPILKNQPLLVSNQEPSLTIGNIVLQTILGPPFRWRFNRKEINFTITSSGTDYVQSVSTFGFIELAWLVDGTNNQWPLEGKLLLTQNQAAAPGRPENVAAQFDDNAGNITFRFDKYADANYQAYIDYQQKAQLLTSMASLWSPVPDEFSYIFNHGFLCLASLLVNDSRFPIFENWFISRLLGAQDGLSEQAKNIFVANWLALTATLKRNDLAVQMGSAGRGR